MSKAVLCAKCLFKHRHQSSNKIVCTGNQSIFFLVPEPDYRPGLLGRDLRYSNFLRHLKKIKEEKSKIK